MLTSKIRLLITPRLIILLLTIAILLCVKLNILITKKYVIVYWDPVTNNVSCHYSREGDALLSAEGGRFAPAPRSIFFHETSCRGGLTSRQACAVESAARAHPRRQVHVLFSAPVTQHVLTHSVLAQLQELKNVVLARVHIAEYSLGIIPEDTLNEMKFSNYSVCHTSDVLRIVTLRKWGGVYLDTDFVVMKSLDNLPPNWVAKQTDGEMANGVLALSDDVTGKNMSAALLKLVLATYDPNVFTWNGPELLYDMMNNLCPESLTSAGGHCDDLYVFEPELFYPIYYEEWQKYFNPEQEIVDNADYPYMHHLWNGLSWNESVHRHSLYANLARKFCPSVYEMYGDKFDSTKYVIVHWETVTNNISCHYSTEGDALPSAEGGRFAPAPRSIFFHETSCRGGLNSRQACAVESAARAHPRRQVHVLFSAPVTQHVLTNSVLAQLQELENVKIARVHIEDYCLGIFPNDLLEELKSSNYSVSHTSDVLRIVTLKKWGGVYLDTDVVVVKSLDNLPPNWVAKQADSEDNTAVLALAEDVTGNNISAALLNKLIDFFDPTTHTANGPGVITDVLEELCQRSVTTSGHCNDFFIFGPELFYPVPYSCAKLYFGRWAPSIECFNNTAHPYMHHMWNQFTWHVDVQKDSHYANLARIFCPSVYNLYGHEFGL